MSTKSGTLHPATRRLAERARLRAGLHVHGREHEVWYVLEGKFRFRLGDALGAYRTSIDKMLSMRRLSL